MTITSEAFQVYEMDSSNPYPLWVEGFLGTDNWHKRSAAASRQLPQSRSSGHVANRDKIHTEIRPMTEW